MAMFRMQDLPGGQWGRAPADPDRKQTRTRGNRSPGAPSRGELLRLLSRCERSANPDLMRQASEMRNMLEQLAEKERAVRAQMLETVNHPSFRVDPELGDLEISEQSTVFYRIFPADGKQGLKQQIAVSSSPEELPVARWPVEVPTGSKRADDLIFLVAVAEAVERLAETMGPKMKGAAAEKLRSHLALYGLHRCVGTLRTMRYQSKLDRLSGENPSSANLARHLGFAIAHAIDPEVALPVQAVSAERAQIVMPMHSA